MNKRDDWKQGDPESLTCRHCGNMRLRKHGTLFCKKCDSPQRDGVTFKATWALITKPRPKTGARPDVGDKVEVLRSAPKQFAPLYGVVCIVTQRDLDEGMVFVEAPKGHTYSIPINHVRKVS